MFTQQCFVTIGDKAEVTDHKLKPELEKKLKKGYGGRQQVTYAAQVTKYPNQAMHVKTHEDPGRLVSTTKRTFLTPNRVVFIHHQEHRLYAEVKEDEIVYHQGEILVSRLIYSNTLQIYEFEMMLTPQTEPYFSR
jgi:hypothetical protein